MPRRSRWHARTRSRSSCSTSTSPARSPTPWRARAPIPSSRTRAENEHRPQGTREAHEQRDGRAEKGARRPAHRPRLGQPARPGPGRGLWPAHAPQPGGHGERPRIAPADGQCLGQGPGDADRQGDPRRRPRAQPVARRPDDPHPDSRAHPGAPQRARQARAQIRRAGACRRAQRAPRRHGGAQEGREGPQDLAGRAPPEVRRGAEADRPLREDGRRHAGHQRERDQDRLMSTAPLPAGPDSSPGPHHVAIIMDGNGRWAKARGLPRVAGHRRGADAVRRVIRGAGELGIPVLTLFAFSTENWTRPADEVSDLMGLLRHYLRHELEELGRNGARLRVIGERSRLAPDIVSDIADAEQRTRSNTRIDVNICINYGSRDEIVQATRNLARKVASGELAPEKIDEDLFERELLTAGVPDPDLLIRTSGEQRISNFLLWQCAYAELVFVDTLWPDFGKEHLERAVTEYRRRERRYGGVGC